MIDEIAKSIVDPWAYCFYNAPSVSKNMYAHGIRIVQWEIKQAKKDKKVIAIGSEISNFISI